MKILKYGLLIILTLVACHASGYGFQGAGGEENKKTPIKKGPLPAPAPKGKTTKGPNTVRPVTVTASAPAPAPVALAELIINTGLADCSIMLDGEMKGRTNSSGMIKLVSLRPGSHFITVGRNGYRDERRDIQLYGGRSETLSFSLSRILSTQELVANAENAYRNARYDEVISNSREALASQPDHPRANLLLGEAYYMSGKTESVEALWKALSLGEVVTLPIKHHHGGAKEWIKGGITGKFDDLCSGNLVLRKGSVEFHSKDKSDEDFNVPIDKIIEVKDQAHEGGRLFVKIKIPKGNKESEKKYNFHAPAATVMRVKVSEVYCQDPSCGPAINTLYTLLQKLK